jgi:DNA-directed RNA polymerase
LPTPAEIDEQVELEREQIRQGLKLLNDNTHKLEQKNYASASVYGVVSIDSVLPLVVARIQDTANRVNEGKTARSFAHIRQYLADLEPQAAAAIALKVLFDRVFSPKQGAATVTNVSGAIGQAVENECMMRHYERNVPGLLKVIKDNYFHRSIGTHQKVKVITTLMNRYEVDHWKPWGQVNRVKLGGWLADCICEVSGYFEKTTIRKGRKTHLELSPTLAFLERKDEIMAQAELFSPLAWPMLIEPNDWTTDGKHGGYLLNEVMRGYNMVRRGDPYLIQGETPVAFLNKIQKVAYTLNPFIVGVAETLMERGIEVGKFIPIVEIPLPPKPPDIADNAEARHDYRRRAAEVCNINAQAFNKSCRTRMTMNAVDKFKDKDKFFIPWSFDYRGRAYPIPAFLTPQDTDFGKSLLKFYEQSFMTPEAEQWLAFQVATTYGLDKAPMTERLASDRPQDAYKVIAEQAKPHVPEHIRPYMDRKTTKRTVMTVPYNAKPFSNRGYIREALKEKGLDVEKEELTAVVKAVRDAMGVIVPGPMRVMKWIEQEVSNAIDRGLQELTWVTPSGFVVRQKLMKKDLKTIDLQLLGRCQIKVAEGDANEVDKNHHKNATAPNLIHSLDASLLHLSAIRFDAPIALIHDSVLCRATDMSVLSAIVRETYMHLFAEHDYLTAWGHQIGAESDPPIIDTLEPESVIESTYFFC